MSRRFRPLFCGSISALFAASGTHAQSVLPGAAPAAPEGAATAPPKPKPASAPSQGAGASAKSAKAPAAPGVAGLVGRPLLLNGKSGLLQISGDDKMVTIDKLRLAGEGVSDPSQRCVVDIVGEKPIEATNVGRPDGLERIPGRHPGLPDIFRCRGRRGACALANHRASSRPPIARPVPASSGPDGSSLAGDAGAIVKERAQVEKAMAKVLQAIQARAADSPAAANLVRDQTAFAGQRDDACRDYVKESLLGYCALRLTEARTALLETRLDEIRAAGPAKATTDKGKKTRWPSFASDPSPRH